MDFRVHPVARPLALYVRMIWTLHGEARDDAAAEPVVPDGCVELVLNVGAPFEQTLDDDRSRQPRAMLVTEVRRPVLIRPTGAVELLGVRFHPAGARAFAAMPMREMIDRATPLDDVLDAQLARDLGAVFSIGSRDERVARVTEALLASLARGRRFDPLIARLARTIEESDGAIEVDALARDAGLTSRQLERRFDDAVGVSPKSLASVVRFQRVLRAIEHGTPGWRHIAAACGYYDQAHLIRDFKRYTGTTPRAFATTELPFSEHFLPMSDSYNTGA
jgi:AraC-like DNA-binding protein